MESKKVWRKWIAFVLCTAMTLSLFFQQSVRADAPCEQHDYEGVEPEWVAASDDAGGFTATATLKCAKCKEAVSVSSDDKENMIVTPEDAKPATCTNSGERPYLAAAKFPNGKKYTTSGNVIIPAKGHRYKDVSSWEWTKDYKAAKAVFTCTVCNGTCEVEAGVESHILQDASCTETGTTTYTATVNIPEKDQGQFQEKSYKDEQTVEEKKKGHDYMAGWNWKWNDETKSYDVKAVFACRRCEDKHEENAAVTSTVTKASCTAPGGTVYEAKVTMEGKEYSDTRSSWSPAKGHNYGKPTWGTWLTNAETGECRITATFTCANGCGETITKTVIGREIRREEPTCTKEGKIIYQAQMGTGVPGETANSPEKEVIIPATGHNYVISDSAWKWDAQKNNYQLEATKSCTKCQDAGTLHVPAQKEVKPATCTQAGKTFYTVSIDLGGRKYKKKIEVLTPAAGHKMVKTAAKPATCQKAGNTEYNTCQTCKKYFSGGQGKKEIAKDSWVINKTGHKIESVEDVKPTKKKTGKLVRRCSVCKKVEETLTIPKTQIEIEVGKSAQVVKNPSKCKVSLGKASDKKYLTLNAKQGKIQIKEIKNYAKYPKSMSLKVKIADKTYTVNVMVKIPAPKVTIRREQFGDYARFTFDYDVKKHGGKVQVRCNLKNANQDTLDRYLSKSKSNEDTYIDFKLYKTKKVKFTITARYGKNVSKETVITR